MWAIALKSVRLSTETEVSETEVPSWSSCYGWEGVWVPLGKPTLWSGILGREGVQITAGPMCCIVQPHQWVHSTERTRMPFQSQSSSCPYHRVPPLAATPSSLSFYSEPHFSDFSSKSLTDFCQSSSLKSGLFFSWRKFSLKGNITSWFVLLSSRDLQSTAEICRAGAWSAASCSEVKAPIVQMWEQGQEAKSIFPCPCEKSSYHITGPIKNHLQGITNFMRLL